MYTIATAGHIDHGKSSLVKALTGTDPDRLPEEKEREMTIELGFASFQLSTGEEVGIIDVPGHERFIKNMISGVGALDMVMFVVAADDGWMPQSEEHLAILRYLDVQHGMIVLTKVDMVDPDWKEMVKSDLRVKTKDTFLDGCEIVEFSAVDNRNLDVVRATVEGMLKTVSRTAPSESARLYIDRVFTIAGTGTVVTGTLREGTFGVGQELYHHPSGQKTKIKNLESFFAHLDKAPPGVRLAIGLQSLERGTVQRGDLIYSSRQLRSSTVLGVMLQVESKQVRYVKHNRDIVLLHGTAEIEGKLFLPSEPVTCDDGASIAVLRLDSPVVSKTGDRFILRLPTPSLLVGGGTVIDPLLELFKRTAIDRWQMLKSASQLDAKALILYELTTRKSVIESELLTQALTLQSEVSDGLNLMIQSGAVIKRDRHLILKSVWDDAAGQILGAVKEFHQQNQHLASMPLAALTTAVDLPEQLLDYALDGLLSANKLERHEAGVKLKAYSAGLTSSQELSRKRMLGLIRENPRQSVSREEIIDADKDGRKLYAFLKQNNEIVDLGGAVYLKETFDRFVAVVVEYLKKHGKISIAEARDLTQTSRKVILPLLEELDRRRITKRDGDYRKICQ